MIERVAVHVTQSYDVFRCVTNATRNQKHKPQKQTIIRVQCYNLFVLILQQLMALASACVRLKQMLQAMNQSSGERMPHSGHFCTQFFSHS